MLYDFRAFRMEVGVHNFWVVESLDLKSCQACGDTIEEALKEFESAELKWLQIAKEHDIPIPERK